MPQLIWEFHNVPEAEVNGWRQLCDGQFSAVKGSGGLYTVVCAVANGPGGTGPAPPTGTAPTPAPGGTDPDPAPAPGGGTSPGPVIIAAPPVDPTKRHDDLNHLHPLVRKKVKAVQKQLNDENIPMKVFEAFRTPQRQRHLFAKGRTTPGPKVTNANAWQSYHQYGMAVDFVRFENGNWNWNDSTQKQRKEWDRFHEIARDNGLEPLSFEKPHVQIVGLSLTRLKNGDYPEGGDEPWASNLSAAILGWAGGGAPPLPEDAPRPPIATPPVPATGAGSAGALTWHSMFGGDAWAYDGNGVYTRDHLGNLKLWRTVGAPITVQEVLAHHGEAIRNASSKYDVAQALIVMTIATETGRFRDVGFTGPDTFRWEQGYTLNATGDDDLDGKEKGDYSAGPMQVLSDTARWMNGVKDLGYDNKKVFPFFKNRPNKDPDDLGLYDPDICIDVGTAYIRHNFPATGDDPLLVAAAYNAGSLRPSSENHWRLRSHGNHIDRAAEWYGDACFVLNS